jgi:hypothetical protein
LATHRSTTTMTDNTNALTLAFGGGFIGAFAYFNFVR